jgi:hypothetical protein
MPTPSGDTTATTTSTGWSVTRWAAVNAAGLGTAFGLFALFGGAVEALGAEHDSLVRDLSLLVAFIFGGIVWAHLRQRALLPELPRARRVGIAAAIALAAGFVGGFLIAGPPLDLILAIWVAGAVAGGVEWRSLRRHLPRPGRLAAVGVPTWLLASVVAIVPAALLGDAIDGALGGGVAGFVGVLLIIGLVGGATGGSLEALALRRRLPGRDT